MKPKSKMQVLHAQQGMGERLGMCVTNGDIEQWACDIRARTYKMRNNVVTVLFDREVQP